MATFAHNPPRYFHKPPGYGKKAPPFGDNCFRRKKRLHSLDVYPSVCMNIHRTQSTVRLLVRPPVRPSLEQSTLIIKQLSSKCKRCHLFCRVNGTRCDIVELMLSFLLFGKLYHLLYQHLSIRIERNIGLAKDSRRKCCHFRKVIHWNQYILSSVLR